MINDNYNIPEIILKYKSGDVQHSFIRSSKDAYEVLKKMFDVDLLEYREECILLLLNRQNRTIGYFKVSSGGITGTVVDAKMIFAVILKSGATAFVLAHNHPSGSKIQSKEDIALTLNLKEASKLLDVNFVDHLILVKDEYTSFADEGLM